MQLSTILIPLSALAAMVLPGILKSDGWADWINGIIAGVIVAVFAGLSVWAGGEFTSNLAVDWAVFAAAYGALLAGPFAPLDSYLQSALNLPFLKPSPINKNPVRVPAGVALPPGASSIPQRASAPPPDTKA